MNILKAILLIILLSIVSLIGILYSKKFSKREEELIEIKNGLNLFKSKIKFTLEPIPNIFNNISNSLKLNIRNIFKDASTYMKDLSAGEAWIKSLKNNKEHTNLSNEDIEKISNLSKMLGLTDLEGQVNNIDFVIELIDEQIKKSIIDKQKNQKLYKTLGVSIGLMITIVLF